MSSMLPFYEFTLFKIYRHSAVYILTVFGLIQRAIDKSMTPRIVTLLWDGDLRVNVSRLILECSLVIQKKKKKLKFEGIFQIPKHLTTASSLIRQR